MIPYPIFMDYLLRLQQVCELADRGLGVQKIAPFKWTVELDWIRQNRGAICSAFLALPEPKLRTISSLKQIGFDEKKLSPLSPSVKLVIPFLILHSFYFPDRQMNSLSVFLENQRNKRPQLAPKFFDQVKIVFHDTLQSLGLMSGTLFRTGAKALLHRGLDNSNIRDLPSSTE